MQRLQVEAALGASTCIRLGDCRCLRNLHWWELNSWPHVTSSQLVGLKRQREKNAPWRIMPMAQNLPWWELNSWPHVTSSQIDGLKCQGEKNAPWRIMPMAPSTGRRQGECARKGAISTPRGGPSHVCKWSTEGDAIRRHTNLPLHFPYAWVWKIKIYKVTNFSNMIRWSMVESLARGGGRCDGTSNLCHYQPLNAHSGPTWTSTPSLCRGARTSPRFSLGLSTGWTSIRLWTQ